MPTNNCSPTHFTHQTRIFEPFTKTTTMKNASCLRFAFNTLLLLLTLLIQLQAKPQQSPLPQITLLQHFLKTASWLKDSPDEQLNKALIHGLELKRGRI